MLYLFIHSGDTGVFRCKGVGGVGLTDMGDEGYLQSDNYAQYLTSISGGDNVHLYEGDIPEPLTLPYLPLLVL